MRPGGGARGGQGPGPQPRQAVQQLLLHGDLGQGQDWGQRCECVLCVVFFGLFCVCCVVFSLVFACVLIFRSFCFFPPRLDLLRPGPSDQQEGPGQEAQATEKVQVQNPVSGEEQRNDKQTNVEYFCANSQV